MDKVGGNTVSKMTVTCLLNCCIKAISHNSDASLLVP